VIGVALFAVTVRTEELPLVIVVGLAVIVTVCGPISTVVFAPHPASRIKHVSGDRTAAFERICSPDRKVHKSSSSHFFPYTDKIDIWSFETSFGM
jgi:hypothetical protein